MSQYNMTTNQSATSASPEDQQRFLSLIPTLLPIAAQLVQSFGNRDISQTSRATTPLTGMPSSPEDQQRSWGSFLQQALPIASQLMQSFGSRDISQTPGLAAPSTGMPSSPEDQQRSWGSFLQQALPIASQLMPSSPEDQQRFLSCFFSRRSTTISIIPTKTASHCVTTNAILGSRDVSQTPGLGAPSTGMPSSPEDQQRFQSLLPTLIPIATQLMQSFRR